MDTNITPFGGITIVHKLLKSAKAAQFIDNELGTRASTKDYKFSDLILSRIYTTLCGGSATEDVNYIRENTLSHLDGISIPSADTILRGEVELSTESEQIDTNSEKGNLINVNDNLNRFLIRSSLKFNSLDAKVEDYTYDFDHQFIPAEKEDAEHSYKQAKGYFPGVASINNTPVYIEGRNGNCSVKNAQLSTHERALKLLNEEEIKPQRARMDCGSYIKEVTDFFQREGLKFFIRAKHSNTLLTKAAQTPNWEKCEINNINYQVSSFDYEFGEHTHRIVAYRYPNKTKQLNIFTQDANNYLFIITNDREISERDAIIFYNQRGASERLFDAQNNDFNWKNMPHSFLNENTAFLIIMAFAHILYRYVIGIIAKFVDGITSASRLKKFIFRVINLPAKFIRSGRRQIIKLSTNNHKLIDYVNTA